MNKKLIGYTYVFLVFITTVLFVDKYQKNEQSFAYLSSNAAVQVSTNASASINESLDFDVQDYKKAAAAKLAENKKAAKPITKESVQVAIAERKPILSRGGSFTKVIEAKKSSETKKVSSNVELLDWWKAGRNAFPIGAVAQVKDVYTGRTFKIKRTMGSNHADCEALSKEDTQIIKSIWGGFSWDTRPVILTVGNRRLAASMSSMAHAGVDSAPFGAIVDNRSVGYGRGENLDSIKGNGMDGHFDVHFLNSTRHKDGKEDPRHQASVMIAAKQ